MATGLQLIVMASDIKCHQNPCVETWGRTARHNLLRMCSGHVRREKDNITRKVDTNK